MMNGNPPKVTAALNNDVLACEMETLATTKAVTDFSEDAVAAWTTKVLGDGARPRTIAVCARAGVNTNSKRAAPEQFMFAFWIVSRSISSSAVDSFVFFI